MTPTASSLGVLATDTQAPEVAETTVAPDTLQALEIVTQASVELVGQLLGGLAGDDVPPPVQEVLGNLVLTGVLHDLSDLVDLRSGQLTFT